MALHDVLVLSPSNISVFSDPASHISAGNVPEKQLPTAAITDMLGRRKRSAGRDPWKALLRTSNTERDDMLGCTKPRFPVNALSFTCICRSAELLPIERGTVPVSELA